MKIHIHKQGIYMAGKAWEIQQKLKEYSQSYETVSEWIHDEKKNPRKHNVILFPLQNR
ncbi:Z-ring formation inhibitor MciZ [Bacillus pinisoli]|uniref:Z-ring formation inhibitor MciZ n=1 Tax=Bacillus pinisoli TaxID=2901866 RepID=UPI001FF41955|nr:Z-ring formation inhibitor MciZ [Bacillus pinisoli]